MWRSPRHFLLTVSCFLHIAHTSEYVEKENALNMFYFGRMPHVACQTSHAQGSIRWNVRDVSVGRSLVSDTKWLRTQHMERIK